ncbi:hypothetical protein ACFPM7_15265 [Actinokineospora guangxiensis]|uniref:Uncharacterized protein n=1 Tax=Actinokineospora guangxiensis TaxID=1490288 RepID=A0ABW0EQY6_9PSEU
MPTPYETAIRPTRGTTAGTVLLVLGTALSVTAIGFVAYLVLGDPPVWTWSLLAIAPWGPIALGLGVWLTRRARRTARLRQSGLRAQAEVNAIRSTSSQYGTSPVLRLSLTVGASGTVDVRTAVPVHLVGALRPGSVLPVLVDPQDPGVVEVDWDAAAHVL